MPGFRMPDGLPFEENLETTRVDGGAVMRIATSDGVVFSARGSGTHQAHTHTFGPDVERDTHQTLFGEVSATGTAGRHTWVAGGALQYERYDSRDVPRFNYTYNVPGVFVQDDFAAAKWITVSASARVDRHNEFGTFASPRVSVLLRPSDPWTVRVSGGRGYFAPTPFTEETEATGLSRIAPLGDAGCGARRQLLGRRDLVARAVRGHRDLLLFADRRSAGRRRDRPFGFSRRDRQLATGSRKLAGPS